MGNLQVEVLDTTELWFGHGDPVRAASGIAPWRDGWIVAQDDAVDAAWWRPGSGTTERLRLLPPRDGHATFSEAAGTKRLKPDLEAACEVETSGGAAVLLLGSGSLPARTDAVLVRAVGDAADVATADLAPVYARIAGVLGLDPGELNLEGACVVGGNLRWFQRGHAGSDVPSASVEVGLHALLAAVTGQGDAADVAVSRPRWHDVGHIDGVALGITDAVALADGHVLVSAAAEDTPDPVADGPVAGSALALLAPDGSTATMATLVGPLAGHKVEGLTCIESAASSAHLVAVVDQDDPDVPSRAAWLEVRWER